jgi:hypothetical protein
MSRLLVALLLAPSAIAAEPVAGGWTFKPNEVHLYRYELKQETSFASAGDQLTYVTAMEWRLALAARAESTADRTRLGVTILAVKATLDGPGSRHDIDTEHPTSAAQGDPVFGALFALAGAGLLVTLDPRTGAVGTVEGGEKIAADIAKREPSPLGPGEPSPLEAQARAAYAPEALARIWSQLLTVPGGVDQQVPLGQPIAGAVVRHWTGTQYTLALPAGVDHLDVTLGREPLAAAGKLTDLSGSGAVTPRNGVPWAANGTLAFTLTLTALTQPVTERQSITWTLSELAIP